MKKSASVRLCNTKNCTRNQRKTKIVYILNFIYAIVVTSMSLSFSSLVSSANNKADDVLSEKIFDGEKEEVYFVTNEFLLPVYAQDIIKTEFTLIEPENNIRYIDLEKFNIEFDNLYKPDNESKTVVNDNITTRKKEDDIKIEKSYLCNNVGYTSARLNLRSEPSTDSDILKIIPYNSTINYSEYSEDEEWVVVKYEDEYAYLNKKYITDDPQPYTEIPVYGDSRKSYMSYDTITSTSSKQYILQNNYGTYTDNNGLRMVEGRYCVAMGSYYSHNVGQYVDVVLENGKIIPCIIGEAKKDKDTINNCSLGADGGAVEFIVDDTKISKLTRKHGDISYIDESWNSNVVAVRLYNKSLLH